MGSKDKKCIEVSSKDEIKEIGNYGTTYFRNEGIFVATTIGYNREDIVFVYYYNDKD